MALRGFWQGRDNRGRRGGVGLRHHPDVAAAIATVVVHFGFSAARFEQPRRFTATHRAGLVRHGGAQPYSASIPTSSSRRKQFVPTKFVSGAVTTSAAIAPDTASACMFLMPSSHWFVVRRHAVRAV